MVALLGVLSGLAIAWYTADAQQALERVANQRNAQEIVSLAVCATVGGAQFVVPGDKEATVRNLVSGTEGKAGIWKGKVFRLTSLDAQALPGALTYVKMDASLLLYEPGGGGQP